MPTRHRPLRPNLSTVLLAAVVATAGCAAARTTNTASAEPPMPTTRDYRLWPFSHASIWNLPLGQGATLAPAGLRPSLESGMTMDENVLILEPDAPLVPVGSTSADWDPSRTRCAAKVPGEIRYSLPIPPTFFTDPGYDGRTPNMAAAILDTDARTLRQTQPFHRCADGTAVTQYDFDAVDIIGDGRLGSHGGSGLSAIGGTIRLGELMPGAAIRHALKFELNAGPYLHYSSDVPGYRWPADRADGYAPTGYRGANPNLVMGSLLALRADFDVGRLRSEPARIIARALRNYGAYIVDDTAYDAYAFAVEWSPRGRVSDQFRATYGFDFSIATNSMCTSRTDECSWSKDMADIISSLHVVTNSSPDAIGGGGRRITQCAPPLDTERSLPLPPGCVAPTPPTTVKPATTRRPPTTKRSRSTTQR
jgi:hypothetical protein